MISLPVLYAIAKHPFFMGVPVLSRWFVDCRSDEGVALDSTNHHPVEQSIKSLPSLAKASPPCVCPALLNTQPQRHTAAYPVE